MIMCDLIHIIHPVSKLHWKQEMCFFSILHPPWVLTSLPGGPKINFPSVLDIITVDLFSQKWTSDYLTPRNELEELLSSPTCTVQEVESFYQNGVNSTERLQIWKWLLGTATCRPRSPVTHGPWAGWITITGSRNLTSHLTVLSDQLIIEKYFFPFCTKFVCQKLLTAGVQSSAISDWSVPERHRDVEIIREEVDLTSCKYRLH